MRFGNSSLFFQHKANLFQENSFAISFLVCDQTVRKGGTKSKAALQPAFITEQHLLQMPFLIQRLSRTNTRMKAKRFKGMHSNSNVACKIQEHKRKRNALNSKQSRAINKH